MTETEPGQPEVQYWDSCLFISFLTNLEANRVDVIRELLDQVQARKSRLRIVVSTLVLAEVRPSETYTKDHYEEIIELFDTDRPYFQFYGLTRGIAKRSRDIGSAHPRLSVPDSIHIATAIEAGADVLFTYDGDQKKESRRSGRMLQYHNQIGMPPLRIEVPTIDHGPLFRGLTQTPD